MADMNKVILVGNLTRDPETRYTPSGAAICSFGMAINRRFNTRDGQQQEEVCFIDIDVWGRQAETCQEYLRKGSAVLVEGRLRFDSWEDRETGKRRSRHTITAERVQFLGGGDDQSQPYPNERHGAQGGGRGGYRDNGNGGRGGYDDRGGDGRGDRGRGASRGDGNYGQGGRGSQRRGNTHGGGRQRETSPPFPDDDPTRPAGHHDQDDSVDDIPF